MIFKDYIPKNAKILYRAESYLFGTLDEYGNVSGYRVSVQITKYYAVKYTKKGYWVARGPYCPMHFIRNDAKKRFAWPTEKEAVESLVARMKCYTKHCERRLEEAKAKLTAAEVTLKQYHT